MLLLTEPTLFYWNLLDDFTSNLKDTYTGTVSLWAKKVQNPNRASHISRSDANSSLTTGSTALTKLTKVTTVSTASAPPATPQTSVIGADDAEIMAGSLLDEDDEPERLAAHTLASLRKHGARSTTAAFVEFPIAIQ